MSAASARSRLSTPALYVTVGFVVLIAVAGAASAAIGDNLDQCRNGVTTPPLGNLAKKCGDFAGFPSWVNGNIGGSNSQYREGDGIPYRLAITDLPAGTHTVKVEYDFSQGGIFALDRLTQFDLTQKSNPCGSTTLVTCSFANVVWGPAMPGEVASPSASQPALANSGNLFVPPALHLNDFPNGRLIAGWASTGQTLAFGAMDANVVQTGLASGNSQRHFSFEITVGSCPSGGCDVMIAWSGHVASEKDWGDNKGAGSISGSPFHMRVLDVDGSGGNQDRSVQLSAIITVGTVQIVKNTVGGNGLFGFTTDGTGNLPLNPQITTVAGTGSVTYTNVEQGIHTIDETSLPAGWSFTSLSCLSGGLPIGTVVGDQVSFDLIAGATVICTYTNTIQPASLTVIKHVVNDNGGIKTASDFTLSATCVVGSFAGAESPGTTFNSLTAGACTVSEIPVTGYAGPVFSGDCNSSGIVTLVNGVTKTCTLTNDDQPATLIVIKHVINDDGGIKTASDFTLSATCVVGSFAGAESPGTTFNSLSAGACTVSEAAVTGYAGPTFTGDCNSSGIVTLVNGATKTCTLTNNDAAGSLTVIKHVINDDGGSKLAGDFTLHVVCGVEIVGSPLDGAESPGTTFNGLSAGACTVSEDAESGYTGPVFSGDCNSSGIVTIVNGAAKTCTLTNNDQPATLIVIKHVVNDNGGTKDAGDFTLSATCVVGSFAGAESPGTSFTGLNAGACTVSEGAESGYTGPVFTGDCNSSGIVTLVNGATKTCTLTNNDQAGSLIVIKHVVNDNGGDASAADFTIHVSCGGSEIDAAAGLESPGRSYPGLDVGTCTVTEDAVSGYAGPTYSGNCDSSGDVTIVAGATRTCTLTNDDEAGSLTVDKVLDPAGAGTFNLRIDGTSHADCVGDGGSTGAVAVDAGIYTVDETACAGTDSAQFVSVISGDCDEFGSVTVGLGESKSCTITNTMKGRLSILKVLSTGADPSGITFQLRVGASTSSAGTLVAGGATDALGVPQFVCGAGAPQGCSIDGILQVAVVPGTYQVCELNVPVGWTTSLSLDPTAFSLDYTHTLDNSNICVVVTVAAGDGFLNTNNLPISVTNTPPPGGDARTIGYWRNHASCKTSNGKQDPVLDDVLANNLSGSVLIGDLNVDTCQEAVALLKKSDVVTGSKRASDAAYGLAAQLMAAVLNVAANAGTCPAANDAIADGQALLDAIGFTGTGSYLGPKSGSPDRATALSIAATLDAYNNNLLCPP